MINLLIGPPGGGKSYEAVVYHIIASLEDGRKVITNLPLNVAELAKIVPAAVTLIEPRTKSKNPACQHAFGCIEDYGDDWRNDKGQGALYVIDEGHKAVPRRGFGSTDPTGRLVDEWYAEHRHEGADVLLITQSHGKLSKAIVDQVQICYRVKKKTAFGDSSGYIRKVQDGVRGDVLSTAERVYDAKYFRYYKSHTRTESAVIEADAKDISPGFLKWKRAGHVAIAIGILGLVFTLWPSDDAAAGASTGARTEEHAEGRPDAAAIVQTPPAARVEPPETSKGLRIIGVMQLGRANDYAIVYNAESAAEVRVPLYQCNRQPFDGWVCSVDGQIVTATTGQAPEPISRPGFASSVIGSS